MMKLSFEYLRQKVGISLLKPANVSAFGRMLSNIFTLQKRETRFGSEYFVKQKMVKQALLLPHAATLLPPLFAHK